MNIIYQLQAAFKQFTIATFNIPESLHDQITLLLNTDPQKHALGDLSSSAPLTLAKTVGKPPRVLAEEITKNFCHPAVLKIEVAGPGFVNIFLTNQALSSVLSDLISLKDQFFSLDTCEDRAVYSLEFVSANPTGPLHLGHGRGGIVGDVLGNVLRFLGHKVIKEFYVNDAGSQITKLGQSFKARCAQVLGKDMPVPEGGYHGEYLTILARNLLENDGEYLLNRPDSFFEEYAKNALLENVRQTLKQYGIEYDVWFSEKSLYTHNKVEQALQILKDRGFIYTTEDGAVWFTATQFGDDKDRVLRKSNGEYTYAASDVAYMIDKIERGANYLIFVLGQDHHSYVTRLKAIAAALGYNPAFLEVILYQLVTLKESGEQVRMSKRAGRIVSLQDVIETVGTDVARFFYLHRKVDAHLDFDIDLALKHTDENPVYYIQYAYVRTGSILEKARQHPELENLTLNDCAALGEQEKLLIKKIVSLKELLYNISKNYQTHLLTYYTVELAHIFHRYYGENRVIDLENIPQSRARLLLIQALRSTFELCFKLLEVTRPERM